MTSSKTGFGLPEPQAANVKMVLRRLREAEISNAALARKLALDPATVGRVLGDGAPSVRVATAIAEHLGVGIGDVLEGRVPKPFSPSVEGHTGDEETCPCENCGYARMMRTR